jgi:drug/metabolite transporter (DMT)-like permease
MVLVILLIFKRFGRGNKTAAPAFIIGGLLSVLIYFIYEAALYGTVTALFSSAFNTLQILVNGLLAFYLKDRVKGV